MRVGKLNADVVPLKQGALHQRLLSTHPIPFHIKLHRISMSSALSFFDAPSSRRVVKLRIMS